MKMKSEFKKMQSKAKRHHNYITAIEREGGEFPNPAEQRTLTNFELFLDYLEIDRFGYYYVMSWGESTPLPNGKAYIQTLLNNDYKAEILIDCQKYGCALELTIPLRRILKKKFEENPNVRVCILTNGLEYEIYTDSRVEDELDQKPIYSFHIMDLKEADYQVLNAISTRCSSEVLQTITSPEKRIAV